MKGVEFLILFRESLKFMSENDLKRDDYLFIPMYQEYEYRRGNNEKYSVIISILAKKYKISESSVKRVLRRLSCEVSK